MVITDKSEVSVVEKEKTHIIVQCIPASFESNFKFNMFADKRYGCMRSLKENCMSFWGNRGQAMFLMNFLYLVVGKDSQSKFSKEALQEAISKMVSLIDYYGIDKIIIPMSCFEEYGYEYSTVYEVLQNELNRGIESNEKDTEKSGEFPLREVIISTKSDYEASETTESKSVNFKATTDIKEVTEENIENRTCSCPECGEIHKINGYETIFMCSNCLSMLHIKENKDILKVVFREIVEQQELKENEEIKAEL